MVRSCFSRYHKIRKEECASGEASRAGRREGFAVVDDHYERAKTRTDRAIQAERL